MDGSNPGSSAPKSKKEQKPGVDSLKPPPRRPEKEIPDKPPRPPPGSDEGAGLS